MNYYLDYPVSALEDIVRLHQRIEDSNMPQKIVDENLLIGSWNIRGFGSVVESWRDNPDKPRRSLRSLIYMAEIIKRFDVIAIQEVKADTSGIRLLLNEFLGSNWGLIVSDVSAGSKGNNERLAFIYDKRRVVPSGLAGEIVLPAEAGGDPTQQFDRTPYIVGFQAAGERFALLTAHIRYGSNPSDRLGEIESLSRFIADEIRDRATAGGEENNLIVLGDFNIDDRGDNPLFQAFVSTGLMVPAQLLNLKTTYSKKPKYYDQIAWFMGNLDLLTNDRAGVINFAGAVYPELDLRQMSFLVSDHFPVWVEFIIDRSKEQIADRLGIDPAMPDPFKAILEG
jgi:endonuclease/exonuclease/phosphatase family metal-dependent hydrolase